MPNIHQVYIVQCKSNGLFLTVDLHYAISFKRAGRFQSLEEAVETGRYHLMDDFEVHSFYEVENALYG